jgi:hypothetical protein
VRWIPDHEKFLSKIVVTDAGCWEWQGGVQPNGYGRFSLSRPRRTLYPHRWSYEHYVGPIPKGLQIDHLCRNRRCANPEHLEAVSPSVNTRRSPDHNSKKLAARTHCLHGHSLDDAYRTKKGARVCRRCAHERYARRPKVTSIDQGRKQLEG